MTNHHLLFLVACVSASASEGGPPARQLLGPGRQIAVGKLRRPIRLQPRQENAHAARSARRSQMHRCQSRRRMGLCLCCVVCMQRVVLLGHSMIHIIFIWPMMDAFKWHGVCAYYDCPCWSWVLFMYISIYLYINRLCFMRFP